MKQILEDFNKLRNDKFSGVKVDLDHPDLELSYKLMKDFVKNHISEDDI